MPGKHIIFHRGRLNIGYAYVGVAPATNQTSLCLKEVRFSDNII